MANFLYRVTFPIFDWLCDRGWLSAEGTFCDYAVVLIVFQAVFGLPIYGLIALLAMAVS